MEETIAQLVKRGSRLVRDAAKTSDRTSLLRELAEVLVELRTRFDHDGHTDWAGRSWDYRMAAQELYDMSGVRPDIAKHIQAVTRYHVGNVLRDRVPHSELRKAGLLQRSPKERIKDTRDETQKILAAVDAVVSKETLARVRALRLATAAEACLERLVDVDFSDIGEDQRENLRKTMSSIDDLLAVAERRLNREARKVRNG